jgi:4-aminobutyrate aminotransferase / (S)-3-amino-2-methylpropionate transaminase / 5-aminovalerate transaminase
LLLTAGQQGNVIRTLMPLPITDDELEEGLSILARAVSETTSRSSPSSAPNLL